MLYERVTKQDEFVVDCHLRMFDRERERAISGPIIEGMFLTDPSETDGKAKDDEHKIAHPQVTSSLVKL